MFETVLAILALVILVAFMYQIAELSHRADMKFFEMIAAKCNERNDTKTPLN